MSDTKTTPEPGEDEKVEVEETETPEPGEDEENETVEPGELPEGDQE